MGCTALLTALLDVQPPRGGRSAQADPGQAGWGGGSPHCSLPTLNKQAHTGKDPTRSQRERERERLSAESDASLPVAHILRNPTPLLRLISNSKNTPDQKVSVRSTAHGFRFPTYSSLHRAPRPATYRDGLPIPWPTQRCMCRINPTHPHRPPAQRRHTATLPHCCHTTRHLAMLGPTCTQPTR